MQCFSAPPSFAFPSLSVVRVLVGQLGHHWPDLEMSVLCVFHTVPLRCSLPQVWGLYFCCSVLGLKQRNYRCPSGPPATSSLLSLARAELQEGVQKLCLMPLFSGLLCLLPLSLEKLPLRSMTFSGPHMEVVASLWGCSYLSW